MNENQRFIKVMEVLHDFQTKYLIQNAQLEALRETIFEIVGEKVTTDPLYPIKAQILFWDILGENMTNLLEQSNTNAQKEIRPQIELIHNKIVELQKELND